MTTLIAVPEGGSNLDIRVERLRLAFAKIDGSREQFIEGTFELASEVKAMRKDMPDHREFGRWLKENGLRVLSKDDCWALRSIADADPAAMRKEIEQSDSISWEVIWRKSSQRTPRKNPKGAPQRISHRSGASQRKRARRIPTAMQEDNPEPKPERKTINLKGLTREQVDPDFKGTQLEFTTKYGHVNLHTKEEIEHNKEQEFLATWLGAMVELERAARTASLAYMAVKQITIEVWKARPGKAAKYQAWCESFALAYEMIEGLNKTETK